MSQSCMHLSVLHRMLTSSILQRRAILEDRQDDRQADRGFGGRHHHHEEREQMWPSTCLNW